MILYSGPMSMFGAKAQIALAEKRLAAEVVMVPFGMRRRYDPKHPEVLRINPKGQVPVLVDGDIEIFDSTQIFEYLETAYPQPPLWPTDARRRVLARQLEHASDEIFFPQVVRLMAGVPAPDAIMAIERYRTTIERRLDHGDFLAGDFSYADIAYLMAELFAVVLGADREGDTPQLDAWRRRVARRPAVAQVVAPMVRYMTGHGLPHPAFVPLAPEPAGSVAGVIERT